MFAPDGFQLANVFYSRIQSHLLTEGKKIIFKHIHELEGYRASESDVEVGGRFPETHEYYKKLVKTLEQNAFWASQYVFLSVFREQNGKRNLWTGRGRPYVTIPQEVFRKPVTIGFDRRLLSSTNLVEVTTEEVNDARYRPALGFKAGSWSRIICNSQFLFRDSVSGRIGRSSRHPLEKVPCINLSTSALDLRLLRATIQIAEAEAEIAKIPEKTGLQPMRKPTVQHEALATAKLVEEQLAPFDLCPVLIKDEDYGQLLSVLGLSQESTSSEHTEVSYDEILAKEFEHSPCTKDEMKTRLFPDMPRREFDFHWKLAALKKPKMSKPGRKG